MSKGMKIFLIVLLVLAFAAILVFVLSRCAREENPAEPSPTASVSPSAPPEESPTPSASASPSASPSPTPSSSENLSGRDERTSLSFSVEGERVTENAVLISADFGTGIRGYGYSLYCLETGYSYKLEEGRDLFYSESLENCGLELTFIPDTDVERALPAFLDSYLHYTEIEYTGDEQLAGTLLTQGVVATDGNHTYEAYLADADGGILTFVLFYPNEAAEGQSPRLHTMLDSFQFNY